MLVNVRSLMFLAGQLVFYLGFAVLGDFFSLDKLTSNRGLKTKVQARGMNVG